jgi:hypothetical protein
MVRKKGSEKRFLTFYKVRSMDESRRSAICLFRSTRSAMPLEGCSEANCSMNRAINDDFIADLVDS